MNGKNVDRLLIAVLVIAVIIGLGMSVYNAGVVQGLTSGGHLAVPAPETGGPVPAPAPNPYYYGPYPYHPWGFGILGCIFPILGLFLIFGLFRALFFHGMGGWRGGPRGNWPGEVPPQVEEWHRRMHEKSKEQPPEDTM